VQELFRLKSLKASLHFPIIKYLCNEELLFNIKFLKIEISRIQKIF